MVGLSGLVGAGRTELGKSIFGSRTYYGGEILYMGEEIGGLHPSNLIEKGVIYLSEDRKLEGLVLDMSLKDNMTMASLKRMYPKTKIDFKREEVVAQESIDKLNIVANSVEHFQNHRL